MDDEERTLIDAILAGDLASRAIYADWLEQRGRVDEAEWIHRYDPERAMMMYAEPLAVIGRRLDPRWRMLLGRPIVANCMRRPCPRDWGSMMTHDGDRVRTCPTCEKRVTYCFDSAQASAADSEVVVYDITYDGS